MCKPPNFHTDPSRGFARYRRSVAAARRAGRVPLRGDHARLRGDAALRAADPADGPLADRRLRPRTAAEPACRCWTSCRRLRRKAAEQCSRRHAVSTSNRSRRPAPGLGPTSNGRSLIAAAAGAVAVRRSGAHAAGRAAPTHARPRSRTRSRSTSGWRVPLGCLVVLMIQYLTGGAWGVLLRPVLETAARTLGAARAPVPPGRRDAVPGRSTRPTRGPGRWSRSPRGEVLDELREQDPAAEPAVRARPGGRSTSRSGSALGYFLRAWSARWRDGDAAAGERLPTLSGPGLVALCDHDHLRGDRLGDVAGAVLALDHVPAALRHRADHRRASRSPPSPPSCCRAYPPLAGRVTPKHLRDLGGLLLTFVMFWAYIAFSQFLLIWAGNLPDETPYYLSGCAAAGSGLASRSSCSTSRCRS